MSAPENVAFTRVSETEWRWAAEGRNYSVRAFPDTGRLIWSSWANTSDGPVFDDGFAQPYAAFLAGNVPRPAPPELIAAVKAYLSAK